MEWFRIFVSAGMGALSAYGLYSIWTIRKLRKENADLIREICDMEDRAFQAEHALKKTHEALAQELLARARAEWELTQTKHAVNRVGWNQKWN